MIFELSRAFENLHSADAWEPYLPAVENLINAHVSGDHYILPTRSIAEQLLTFDFFSRRQRAVLEHDILAKFSTLVAGARGAAVTIYLTRDGEFSTGIRPNQRAMPLKLFVDTELCARTRVLVENSARDGAFWLAIVQTLATDVNVTTIPRIDFEMGGGSAIGDVYRQKIEQRNPTLCLVDSDRDFPGGPLGETARRVEDLRGTEAVPTARAYILGVREVENFIPVEVLADIYSRNPAVQARLETFQRLESVSKDPHCAPGTEYNRFVDMKHGLRRSIIRRHEAIAGDFFRRLWKVATPQETVFDSDEGDEIIFAGIANDLLEKTVEFQSVQPANRARMRARIKDLMHCPELVEIVRVILSFCAAPGRQRV